MSTSKHESAISSFYFVYGIINVDHKLYVGYSSNVWQKIDEHNRVKGKENTKHDVGWFPFFIMCFMTEDDAISMKSYIRKNYQNFLQQTNNSIREVFSQINVAFDDRNIKIAHTNPNRTRKKASKRRKSESGFVKSLILRGKPKPPGEW
jgi:predicted GIY-YIG superfamily endonuclease